MTVSPVAKARLASFLTPAGSSAGQQTTVGDNRMSNDNKKGTGIQGAAKYSTRRTRHGAGRRYLQGDKERTTGIQESLDWRAAIQPAPAAQPSRPAQPATTAIKETGEKFTRNIPQYLRKNDKNLDNIDQEHTWWSDNTKSDNENPSDNTVSSIEEQHEPLESSNDLWDTSSGAPFDFEESKTKFLALGGRTSHPSMGESSPSANPDTLVNPGTPPKVSIWVDIKARYWRNVALLASQKASQKVPQKASNNHPKSSSSPWNYAVLSPPVASYATTSPEDLTAHRGWFDKAKRKPHPGGSWKATSTLTRHPLWMDFDHASARWVFRNI
jgi:hypothetical protein